MNSLAVGLVLGLAVAGNADWSQWRGPDRTGVLGGIEATRPWPARLTRRWTTGVGSGQSSPIVSGRTAFLFGREDGSEVVHAIDLATGKVRWRQGYRAPYRVYPGALTYGDGPKSTPVVYEGRVFTLGIGGILSAFDAAEGRILWQKDFTGRFPATSPPFGTSMSPLVAGGLLVAHAGGHDGGALIAFDPATGREKWALSGDGPSYSSPILTRFMGQDQLVVQVHRKILGVDPVAGRLLWSLPFVTPCDQNIVTPLRAGDLIVVSSMDKGTMGIRVTRNGAKWVSEVAWHTTEVSMYMSSPVLANGRVFGLSHRKKGQYFALDPATGAVQWKSDAGQGENAAFVVAGESILVLQGDGELLVLPRDAATFAPARRYPVADSATSAHPVPTELGVLIKDGNTLSLHVAGAADR